MDSGIKDKVAILGMGCAKFGERYDADAEDLMVEAFEDSFYYLSPNIYIWPRKLQPNRRMVL